MRGATAFDYSNYCSDTTVLNPHWRHERGSCTNPRLRRNGSCTTDSATCCCSFLWSTLPMLQNGTIDHQDMQESQRRIQIRNRAANQSRIKHKCCGKRHHTNIFHFAELLRKSDLLAVINHPYTTNARTSPTFSRPSCSTCRFDSR